MGEFLAETFGKSLVFPFLFMFGLSDLSLTLCTSQRVAKWCTMRAWCWMTSKIIGSLPSFQLIKRICFKFSEVRRGGPCLHLKYGVDTAVNLGSFMNFYPMHFIIKNKVYPDDISRQLSQIFLEEQVHIHLGQGWDICWHNPNRMGGRNVSESQYLQMVSHKTGVLARLIVRLTCAALELPQNLTKQISTYAERIGLAFQIQDDFLNLQPGEKYINTKGYRGEDIHEVTDFFTTYYSLNAKFTIFREN